MKRATLASPLRLSAQLTVLIQQLAEMFWKGDMKIVARFLILLTASGLLIAEQNLTGKWTIHNTIGGEESELQCNVVQSGDVLRGTCKVEGHEVELTGSVNGSRVSWQYEFELYGSSMTTTYTAAVTGTKKIRGSVEVQPIGFTGDFEATALQDK